jgi:Zn-dependent oligopeptidase
MMAARNLGSGLEWEGQTFLGLLDFTYHSDEDGVVDTTAVRTEVYKRTRLFEPVDGLISQASFGHLNGYHAGYYSYLWSLVYAQDMFSRFEAEGIMNPKTAREYRSKVLAKGGTADALDLVQDFLGRAPNADAFLRHLGLTK